MELLEIKTKLFNFNLWTKCECLQLFYFDSTENWKRNEISNFFYRNTKYSFGANLNILIEIYAVSGKILKISTPDSLEIRQIRQPTRRDSRVYCRSLISGNPALILPRVRALSSPQHPPVQFSHLPSPCFTAHPVYWFYKLVRILRESDEHSSPSFSSLHLSASSSPIRLREKERKRKRKREIKKKRWSVRIRDLYRIRNIMSYTMFFRFEKKSTSLFMRNIETNV